jgi:flagellar hook-associated protein 1 FlgK
VGVNLDTELSQLVVYQNAYSASARVIATIQTMFDTLMNA